MRRPLASELSLAYQIEAMEFASRNAAKLWVIDNQLSRRNLPEFAQIELRRHRYDVVAEMARVKKSDGGSTGGRTAGRGRPKSDDRLTANFREAYSPPSQDSERTNETPPAKPPRKERETSTKIGKEIGVSGRTVDKGMAIIKAAEEGKVDPETMQKLRAGERSIHSVYNTVKNEAKREIVKAAARRRSRRRLS